METKRLSSAMTFFYKFIFSSTWITGFGAGTVALWLGAFHGKGASASPDEMKWLFLVGWLLGTVFILWGCAGLKRVGLGRDSIFISNYRHEIVVPITMIERVAENKWINIRPVTIHFRSSTEFGNIVTFMPQWRLLFPWNSHPVVEELTIAAQCGQNG
jgi:hypothetical protein